ncbi:hypothetical protein Acid345_1298 [Candidatus Koribacter versatilis Ellin345]|uniref:ATP synthase protein I n=1 Tax=Koribacter versatilis (strain Ellin345) TaxID=204669 RepID=Q1IS50_KORVE|nr:ATP synthase subunit I [Candidatus Koribacter versatilis]ABF40300.1 hypothetical protein Acid345_1298 [Candidatus Koribacter versatilis Ellin345]
MTSQEQAAEAFYSGALTRIKRLIPIFAVAVLPFLLWRWHWQVGAGFALGAVLSAYNFWSLSRSVDALADRITNAGSKESGARIVGLMLLRYGVLGAAAYVILRSSVAALYGLLGGLVLPVAAMAVEAMYELYVALRRGL